MYVIFDDATEKRPLIDFKSTQSYICFAFESDVTNDMFTAVTSISMYSDDDMYLAKYIIDKYNSVCNGNEFYLKDKKDVVDIDDIKAEKIAESKALLAEWLEANPMQWSDGKWYAVTFEKQSLLNGNLASYERAANAGIQYPLKWNSTGDSCVEWTYENLLDLSLTIAAYVAPKVSQQQEIELAINACETSEDVLNININYN